MGGWTDEWWMAVNGWTDGWMDEWWMDGWTNEQMSRRTVIIPLTLQTCPSPLSSHLPDKTSKTQLCPLYSVAHAAGEKHKITLNDSLKITDSGQKQAWHCHSALTQLWVASQLLLRHPPSPTILTLAGKLFSPENRRERPCSPAGLVHFLEPSPSPQHTLTALVIHCNLSSEPPGPLAPDSFAPAPSWLHCKLAFPGTVPRNYLRQGSHVCHVGTLAGPHPSAALEALTTPL